MEFSMRSMTWAPWGISAATAETASNNNAERRMMDTPALILLADARLPGRAEFRVAVAVRTLLQEQRCVDRFPAGVDGICVSGCVQRIEAVAPKVESVNAGG